MKFVSNIQQRKASNIIYSKDIDSLKQAIEDDRNSVLPNNIVITAHNIDNVEKGYNKYNGTAYEMFYLDNNKNINRLSYNIQEGNGLTVSDYKLYLGIDNNTIKTQGTKKTLYIDNDNLRSAYYNYKGITKGDNEIYLDSFVNDIKEYGTVSSINGEISLNPGVMMEMREIAYYFNKYINLNELIQDRIVDLLQGHIFNVGDILYRNPTTYELTFKQYKNYEPYMVCIIASNVMDDRYPRFIPIQNHTISYKPFYNSESSLLNVKSLYKKVPVYADDLFSITSDSEITGASYGYIATNQANWGNNWANPFYKTTEHYFANSSTDFNSELKWWVYQDGAHKYGKYSLDEGTIVTDSIEAEDDSTPGEFNITVNIEFSDGFTSDYDITMAWDEDEQNFYNKYAVQPKKSYRTPLDDVKAYNEGEEVGLNNVSRNPYNFGNNKSNIDIPEELKGYIKEDYEVNFNDEDVIYGRLVDIEHMKDYIADDKFRYSNEIYYGCGGGCGSNGGCAFCSCDCNIPCNCSCVSGHCGNNCTNDCKNDCDCVGGHCEFEAPCQIDGQLCTPILCSELTTCTKFNSGPIYQNIHHSSYTFALTLQEGLLDDEELEYAYLRIYVSDGTLNNNQWYMIPYNNTEVSRIFTKYNTPSYIRGGVVKIVAYSSPNFVDKNYINLGENQIVRYTENKGDLVNYKIFGLSNTQDLIYGEGETNEGGECTSDGAGGNGEGGECTSDESGSSSSTQIITCNSVYPQVISCSAVTVSGCDSFTGGNTGCTEDTTGGNSYNGGTSYNGLNSYTLTNFISEPANKNMTIMKGKSKTINIKTTPENFNALFSWHFDNEEYIDYEKSTNTKSCIIYGVKKTPTPIILTIVCVDYPELPRIYKNISIIETEDEEIEDDTNENGIITTHIYHKYYKYTFGQIPFSFNLNNCLISKVYKKTKTGNTVIKLMPDNGDIINLSVRIPLYYFWINECLINNGSNEYIFKKGFLIILTDTTRYIDFDPEDLSDSYEAQVKLYFRPYIIESTGEIGPSELLIGRFKLKPTITNDGILVFINTTDNNKKLTQLQYQYLHSVKISNIFKNGNIIDVNVIKFGVPSNIASMNISEVSQTANE